MPSGSYKQVDVLCPYYVTDDGHSTIVCEGLVPDSRCHTVFRRRREYSTQMTQFCCRSYWSCEICEALDNKYKEDET